MDQEEEIDESIPTEEAGELFDILEKLPSIEPGRNDPCLCGSGKKYKKCCLEKDRSPSSCPKTHLLSFQIKKDALTPEESQNSYPALPEEAEKLMAVLFRDLHEYPETIDSENCDYFQQLNALRSKYPESPVILNYLTNGYHLLGQQDRVDELVAETCEKFPDYLFALTAQAHIYLKSGFPEKALGVLKGAYTLKQLYPHRDVFHVSEVKAFEHFIVIYCCETADLKQAEIHLQIMEEVLEEKDAMLRSAQKMVRRARVLRNFKAGVSRLARAAK